MVNMDEFFLRYTKICTQILRSLILTYSSLVSLIIVISHLHDDIPSSDVESVLDTKGSPYC